MSFINVLLGREPLIADLPHALKGKGHHGEYLTEYALDHGNVPGRLELYHNVLVPRSGITSSTEIDVLMLHEKGIYVFESKNYSGWIFGNAEQRHWTMSLKGGKKERFYNPIMQNRSHVKALAEAIDVPTSLFRSFVVFSERCELKDVPRNTEEYVICQRHHLTRDVIRDLKKRDIVFGEERFALLKGKLDELSAASTEEEKRFHVLETEVATAGTTCPFCGKPLVERHRKSDGGMFVGCSGFPKCRYTRPEW